MRASRAWPADRATAAADQPIRLLIVDDSSVARAVLARMVGTRDDIIVAATAANAADALDALKTIRVDIVLLDLEMPGATGLEALPDILAAGRGARVLVVSSMAEEGAEMTVRALALGATDTLPKPGSSAFGGRFADMLVDRIRRIGRIAMPSDAAEARPRAAEEIQLRNVDSWTPGCIAIGASTGGIHAINEFLAGLPAVVGVPILVTQHLPALFMPYFARQLEAASGRKARVVQDGERLDNDVIHVAPGTAHLGLVRIGTAVHVKLHDRPSPSGCLPSVDPMLAAVGQAYGRGGIAVVLSGMGRDGLIGSRQLAACGGVVLAQDPATSAIWGMPRAVAEAGLASAVLPPRDLARRIAVRIGEDLWK